MAVSVLKQARLFGTLLDWEAEQQGVIQHLIWITMTQAHHKNGSNL